MSTITLTPAQAIAQQAAELLWAIATCEDSAVARFDSGPYRAAELAFSTAVIAAYDLDAAEAAEARDLLAEYGPHDAMTGTTGRGIYSYVQLARDLAARHLAEEVERQATREVAWDGPEVRWDTFRADGAQVGSAWLCEGQVGAYLRLLPAGWSVRVAPRDPAESWRDADDAQLSRIESSACDR